MKDLLKMAALQLATKTSELILESKSALAAGNTNYSVQCSVAALVLNSLGQVAQRLSEEL